MLRQESIGTQTEAGHFGLKAARYIQRFAGKPPQKEQFAVAPIAGENAQAILKQGRKQVSVGREPLICGGGRIGLFQGTWWFFQGTLAPLLTFFT